MPYMRMCMYIYIHRHAYMHTNKHTYMYIHMACMHMNAATSRSARMYVEQGLCGCMTYACMYVRMDVSTQIRAAHICACMTCTL